MAGALEAEPGDLILQAKQLNIPAVTLEVRTDLLDRLLQPGRKVYRMQPMNKQQAADDRVGNQSIQDVSAIRPAAADNFQDARQAISIKGQKRLETLVDGGAGDRVTKFFGLLDQALQLAAFLEGIFSRRG